MPDLAAVEDVEGKFYLGPYVNDIDTLFRELAVEADSSYGMMEGHIFIFDYPNGVLSEQVTFTLSDGEFQVVHRMNVTVSPVNDVPELLRANVDPPEGSEGTSFRFSVVFKDIDISSDTPVVEVVIDGVKYRCARDELDTGLHEEGVVFFLERDLGSGKHFFHFNADDGDGGEVTTETLSIVVKESSGSMLKIDSSTLMIISLIIGAVVMVAIILTGRKRISGSSG